MGRKIFVGNLSFDTTSKDLESLFATCGTCDGTERWSRRSLVFAPLQLFSDSIRPDLWQSC